MSRKNRSSRKKSRNRKNNWYEINEESGYNENRSDIRRIADHYREEDLKKFNKRINKQVILSPRGENQRIYVYNLENPGSHVVFAMGPAGCGKTMLAMQAAIKGLIENRYEKIVITRPNVAVDDKDIGFLPGDMHKKMAPWIAPLVDVMKEIYTPNEIKTMFRDEVVEIVPIAFMRGRTFKNSFIIVDEAQGTTPNSLLSILTRIGDNSKLVITGDLDQTDHHGPNGLSDFLRRYDLHKENMEGISVNHFDKTDIQRHPIISKILDIYEDVKPD